MKKIKWFLWIWGCAFAATVAAQDDAVSRIIALGKDDNQVMKHLDVLTNRFGGRPVGSDAYDNAVDWLAATFRDWGLEVELDEAGSLPVGFNRGPWFGRMLGGEQAMQLHFVTPSYTSGTKGLQRGHVLLEPKTREEFEQMKGALKGAWVLIGGKSNGWAIDASAAGDSMRAAILAENDSAKQRNDLIIRRKIDEKDQKGKKITGTNNKTDVLESIKEEPALFYKEMCEAGILGIIQSAPVPLVALYNRSLVNDSTMTFDRLPTVPDIKLDEHQYKIIEQMAKERRAFELEFDIRNHFKIGPVKYYSVVGKIEGSEYPDEYVILSGHLDSFDAATGGIDCGAGVTSVIEAARLVAKSGAKPKRTMLFIAFAGEEFGLLGAQAWAASHQSLWDRISNVFNRDGGPLPPVGVSVHKAACEDFVRICEPIKAIRPDIPFEVKEIGVRPRPVRLGGTDATVFAVKGIPTVTLEEKDVKGYNFNYREIWHTERDLYTKSIPEYQEHAATVMAIVGLGVANLDHLISREGMYE
ncbi:MAG: M28 family peptidase [Tannerella sp.]|jgi:hypothetical protein|nr:M28 family peptidase [Tannerella sp.]